jgi:hypothetical protein
MFGTFLEAAGGGEFFFRVAAALTGHSPGGPAKVAVVSSAPFGTMSGSPTVDVVVVVTGSVTIPKLEKRSCPPQSTEKRLLRSFGFILRLRVPQSREAKRNGFSRTSDNPRFSDGGAAALAGPPEKEPRPRGQLSEP